MQSAIPYLVEAAQSLAETLVKNAGTEGWYCVGVSEDARDPHLIIFTTTRARSNSLVAFVGYSYKGFKVVGRALGPKLKIVKVPGM
jgi:hypothetical protein